MNFSTESWLSSALATYNVSASLYICTQETPDIRFDPQSYQDHLQDLVLSSQHLPDFQLSYNFPCQHHPSDLRQDLANHLLKQDWNLKHEKVKLYINLGQEVLNNLEDFESVKDSVAASQLTLE